MAALEKLVEWNDDGLIEPGAPSIAWSDLRAFSEANVNWADMQILTKANVNWSDMEVLTKANVNWSDLSVLAQANVNWTDLQAMSAANVNWSDLAYMTGTGLNWTDLSGQSTSNVNWTDLARMSVADINWADIATIGGKIDTLVTNMDTDTLNTIVASLEDIPEQMDDMKETMDDMEESVNTKLDEVEAMMGTNTDSSTTGSVFGRIAAVNALATSITGLIGAATDKDTVTTSLFGKLAKLQSAQGDLEGTAIQIKDEVVAIRSELGGQGSAETVVQGIQNLKVLLDKLQKASDAIAETGKDTNDLAHDMINKLVDSANNSMDALGFIGQKIEKLSLDQAANKDLVQAKLEEVKTFLITIKEATTSGQVKDDEKTEQAVVKAWLESGTQ